MVMPADLGLREPHDKRTRLADPALRRAVEAAVKRRVRGGDADDIVQAALADVLSAARVPDDAEEFRRFVFAVTRNKVFDHFRRRVREVPEEEALEPAAAEAPLSARDILRWAEEKLPDAEAEHTLEWMLREGDGEKLEHIARDAQVPAPRVRQRVSRLRRFLRERWAAELMLTVLGLVVLSSGAIVYYAHQHQPHEVAKPEPQISPELPPSPEERGRELRRAALERCPTGDAAQCLEGLDRARALDPTGDRAPEVANARSAAAARLAPTPSALPIPSATTVPSATPIRRTAPHTAPTSTETPSPRIAPKVTPSFGSSGSSI
ncbi:MAG TPA: sigma-70 family RNA polymerase sigma factor [Polyangiaceae bacterium]|jgi:RNA polymerase sigma factor (sigma-70 family)|nr:sigma-70 family RNA polymerase sigma factor [Polyangiaceae bacterium]